MKITASQLKTIIKEEIAKKLLKEELDPMALAQRISLAMSAAKLGPALRLPLEQAGVDTVAMHHVAFKGEGSVEERLSDLAGMSTDEKVQKAHNALYKMATGEDEGAKKHAKDIRKNMPVWAEEGSLSASRLRTRRGGPVESPQDLIKWYSSIMGDKK